MQEWPVDKDRKITCPAKWINCQSLKKEQSPVTHNRIIASWQDEKIVILQDGKIASCLRQRNCQSCKTEK